MNAQGSAQSGKTAFVLSGGGAKGSFSAGALDYLITEAGIVPQVITGTSAGSICGAVLAQARGRDEFVATARALREDIIAMSAPGVAFKAQNWLSTLDGTPLGDDIATLIAGKSRPPIPADPTMDTDILADAPTPGFSLHQGWDDLRSLVATVALKHQSFKAFSSEDRSVMLLDPLEDAFHGRTPGSGPSPIDESAIARPGLDLRLTVTALNDGCIRFVTGDGAVVELDAQTPAPGAPRPGVIEGVLASASVPMVFEPRTIGTDVYVDGGVLENIPLAAATALGATCSYVILADPLRCPSPTMDYAKADLFNVLFRAESTVSFYDQQRRGMILPADADNVVSVIDPRVLVVSTFETTVGLLTINMDYGWLTACAVTADVSDTSRERARVLADQIIIGRLRSWYLAAGLVADSEASRQALSSARALVSSALDDWSGLGLALPEGAGEWKSQATAD